MYTFLKCKIDSYLRKKPTTISPMTHDAEIIVKYGKLVEPWLLTACDGVDEFFFSSRESGGSSCVVSLLEDTISSPEL